jgi:hypothetical protein
LVCDKNFDSTPRARLTLSDRQKGTRILKKLKKEHSSLEDESQKAQLQQRIHNAEVDVNYTIYYPLMKPYSSLYPKSKSKKSDDSEDADDGDDADKSKGEELDGPKGNVDMWKAVEQATKEGTLGLDRLRYSRDAVPAAPPKKVKKPKAKEGKEKTHDEKKAPSYNSHGAQQEDEDSDGGFFE